MMKLPSNFQIDSLFVGQEKWKTQMQSNLSHSPSVPYLFATLKAASGNGVCAYDAHHLHKLFQKNGYTHPETGEKCTFVDYFIVRKKDEKPELYKRCKPTTISIQTFAAACCRNNAYAARKAHLTWLKNEAANTNNAKNRDLLQKECTYWAAILLNFDLSDHDRQEILSVIHAVPHINMTLIGSWKTKKQLTTLEFSQINDHFTAAYKSNSEDIPTLLEWSAFLCRHSTTELEKAQIANFIIKAARILSHDKTINITDNLKQKLLNLMEQSESTEKILDSICKDLETLSIT